MKRFVFLISAPLWVLGFSSTASAQPMGWQCEAGEYGDGTCDCGCGAPDSDCPAGERFIVCERDQCTGGLVPWEHQPHTCMTSACGDGWRDEARGEQCDDGEGLMGGGCNRDCTAVNDGWVCGDRAEQCAPGMDPPADAGAPVDAGSTDAGAPVPDASVVATDAGTRDAGSMDPGIPQPESGCSISGSPKDLGVVLALFALFAAWRRRLV